MRAAVFAYHNMGVLGIRALLAAGFEIPLVFTHEDDPGENVWFGSVADLCREEGIPFVTPADPGEPGWLERVKECGPDMIFSFYYRYMLSAELLALAPRGAYNLHGSLLPAYRGRCPVNWVIINGESETGVTLHEMEAKPDAGAIVARRRVAIDVGDTAATLFARLESEAAMLLAEILPRMKRGDIPRTPQDLALGSYYGGRRPADGRIDWALSARKIDCLIRGVTRPYPGAFGKLDGKTCVIWRARVVQEVSLKPGLIKDGLIGTGSGALEPQEMEYDNETREGAPLRDFLREHEGEILR